MGRDSKQEWYRGQGRGTVLSESPVRPSAPGEVRNGAEYGERERKEKKFL